MQTLMELRWPLLIAAFFCALMWAAALAPPFFYEVSQTLPLNLALYAAAPLQAAGVYAMAAKRGFDLTTRAWPLIIGAAATLAWAIALLGNLAGAVTGSGGLVYYFYVIQPMAAVGFALQLAALIGFARARA